VAQFIAVPYPGTPPQCGGDGPPGGYQLKYIGVYNIHDPLAAESMLLVPYAMTNTAYATQAIYHNHPIYVAAGNPAVKLTQ